MREGIAALTEADMAVLELMAAGKTNKEIQRALGMTEYAVKRHVEAVFDKLRVQNRTEAANRWRDWKDGS